MKSQKSKTLSLDKNHIYTFIQSFTHSKGRTLEWLYGCMHFVSIKFLLFIVSSLFLSACDKEPPIPEDKFIKIYVDLLVIQDTTLTGNLNVDSAKTLVLDRFNVTPKEYDETIEYYNSHPEKWIVFFDSATAYVEALRKEVDE